MTKSALETIYRAYIACLNDRDWPALSRFVDEEVRHNGRPFGLSGYRAMLEQDVRDIPDLRFNIDQLICDPPSIAARLIFDCRPAGSFLGLPVKGRRVIFSENVLYAFRNNLIREVWSVVDKAAIESQLIDQAG